MRFLLLSILFVSFFLGCDNATSDSGSSLDKINQYIINPKSADPGISKGLDNYNVYQPAHSDQKPQLFIFLPGSSVGPKVYQKLLKAGAQNGYYSIGLSYQNDRLLASLCGDQDPECQGNVVREELEGKDYSDKIEVSPSSSITNRIITLLQYLQKQHPDANWQQFLDDGSIKWSTVTIAGHSQGSTNAAYIGWHRSVQRVVMFNGPYGVADSTGILVSWLNDDRKTPAAAFWGFGNINDQVTAFHLMNSAWSALNMAGSPVLVDSNTTPFQHSHRLSTAVTTSDGVFNSAHGSTCADSQTPLDNDGNPVFLPVWNYLCFPN